MTSRNRPSGRGPNYYRNNPTRRHGEANLDDQDQHCYSNEGYRYEERQPRHNRAPVPSQEASRTMVAEQDYNDPVAIYATENETTPRYHNYYNAVPNNQNLSFIQGNSNIGERINYRPPLPQDTRRSHPVDHDHESGASYQMQSQIGDDPSYNVNYQTSVPDGRYSGTNDSPWRRYNSNRGSLESINASPLDSRTYQETNDNQLQVWQNPNPHWEPERHQTSGVPYNDLPYRQESHPQYPPGTRGQAPRYPTGGGSQNFDNVNSQMHGPEETPRISRRRQPSGSLRRYGSNLDDQRAYSSVDNQRSEGNERRPTASNWRTKALIEDPVVRIMDYYDHWCLVICRVDTGNTLGDLVSRGTVEKLGLGNRINGAATRTGRTLGGRLETLGTIELNYRVNTDGQTEHYDGTFHVFDDSDVKDFDVLFAPGHKDGDYVHMVAVEKHGETEEEQRERQKAQRRLVEERRRMEELRRGMRQKREEREEMEERQRRADFTRRRDGGGGQGW